MLAVELLGQLSREPQALLVHQPESWKNNDKSVDSTDLFFYKSQNGIFFADSSSVTFFENDFLDLNPALEGIRLDQRQSTLTTQTY